MEHSNSYGLIDCALRDAGRQLDIFKIDLSPTSLETLANHIGKHSLAMMAVRPDKIELIGVIVGLCIKLTCEKEARAFMKAEEAANAATNK